LDFSLIVVRIFVTDWPRAVRFYTETLGMPVLFRDEELGWAQLATGEAQLAIERFTPETDERAEEAQHLVGRFVGASLAVEDIYGAYELLGSRGVDFVAPHEQMSWGGVLAHIRDPDGNILNHGGQPRP
jgi:catechol 2,3-dioxygenase-like lactoylglutathione lyase family enzyme